MVNETEIEAENAYIDPLSVRAAEIATSLDARLLAAQVLICGTDGNGSLPPHMKNLFNDCPPGGVMLFKRNLDSANDVIRTFIAEIDSLITNKSGLPPFIAVDHEGGEVSRFRRGVADLPAASSYFEKLLDPASDTRENMLKKIEADSLRAGRKINELGININFAPVAETLIKYNGVFLQSRSYGQDAFFTAEAATVFMRSMQEAGVLCVIKHFPGSAGADPHYKASVINNDKSFLDEMVYPFARLIENGARAVMVAHTLVPAIDSETASLSPAVMQDWLRGELGFGGIIISDDFSMAAAGGDNPAQSAVRSIAAGADMVLVWQPDILRTQRAIVSALEDGRLSRERLEKAAARVIYEKLKMELITEE